MDENKEKIAACYWWVRNSSSVWNPVKVILFKPEIIVDNPHKDWRCDIEIFWPDRNIIRRSGFGVDSMSALEAGINMLHAEGEHLLSQLGEAFSMDKGNPNTFTKDKGR